MLQDHTKHFVWFGVNIVKYLFKRIYEKMGLVIVGNNGCTIL